MGREESVAGVPGSARNPQGCVKTEQEGRKAKTWEGRMADNTCFLFLPEKSQSCAGPVSPLDTFISSKGYQLYACSSHSFVFETSVVNRVNIKHMG